MRSPSTSARTRRCAVTVAVLVALAVVVVGARPAAAVPLNTCVGPQDLTDRITMKLCAASASYSGTYRVGTAGLYRTVVDYPGLRRPFGQCVEKFRFTGTDGTDVTKAVDCRDAANIDHRDLPNVDVFCHLNATYQITAWVNYRFVGLRQTFHSTPQMTTGKVGCSS